MVTNDHFLVVGVVTGDGDVFKSTVDLYDVDFTMVGLNVVLAVVDFKVVPDVDLVADSIVGFVVIGGCVALELDIATADDDWLPVWAW